MYRFNPIMTRIKNLINTETIGNIKYINFNFSHTLEQELVERKNYRLKKDEGGGAFYDLGAYGVNLCNYLLDSYPIDILSSLSLNHNDNKADLTSIAILKYQNKVISNITSSFQFFGNHLQISGTDGVIEVSNIISQEKGNLILKKFRSKEIHSEEFPSFNSYIAEINHFNECILNNKEPLIKPEDTIQMLETTNKLIKSINWI